VDIHKVIQRTRRYEYSDGLRDLQLAVMFISFGLQSWLVFEPRWWAILLGLKDSAGKWAMWTAVLLFLSLPVCVTWGALGIMTYLRKRWLWRESGMVKASRIIVPRPLTVFAGAIAIGGILVGVGLQAAGQVNDTFVWRMIWAAAGWSTGVMLVGLGRHVGLARYLWLGGMTVLISTIVLVLPLTFSQTGLVFGMAWGIMFAVAGTVTLARMWSSQRVAKNDV
jgi:hypothetical protein